jgi:glycosidase
MYQDFGFSQWSDNQWGCKVFVPDNAIDPNQYQRGGSPQIASIRIVGDFQHLLGATDWDSPSGLVMNETAHPNGRLFTYALPKAFPNGYYQYKLFVSFNNGSARWLGDPCTKYGGDEQDNSAFVIGGSPIVVTPLANPRPPAELIIYELMIDDFTAEYRADRAPVDAVVDKLDDLVALGFNAIEFMPWIAWPDEDGFSWGYDPGYFFSVESSYVSVAGKPLEKLARLAALISECHKRQLHVVMDIVLQHARQGTITGGFPYFWLWQTPSESPFGIPGQTSFGSIPLDYSNACTLQFVADTCKYWIDRFSIDGFRFDQVSGFHNPQFPTQGAPALIANLKAYLADKKLPNFALMLEDTWDYDVMQDTNEIGATNGWFDMFRDRPLNALDHGSVGPEYMRVLNAARDFNAPIGPVIYIENHDHSSITFAAHGRDQWFRTQPYMIALATCSGAVLVHNGQEFGQAELLWEDDSHAPPQFKRVQPRPLHWDETTDATGTTMRGLYQRMLAVRKEHAGLLSPNFYPNNYDYSWTHFSPDGYGIDVDKQVVIYHRWGNAADGGLERFIIALNFSGFMQWVDIPFSTNGTWIDLLNGNMPFNVDGYALRNFGLDSNWGRIFYQKA